MKYYIEFNQMKLVWRRAGARARKKFLTWLDEEGFRGKAAG